jgi:hypothetical protein
MRIAYQRKHDINSYRLLTNKIMAFVLGLESDDGFWIPGIGDESPKDLASGIRLDNKDRFETSRREFSIAPGI